MNWLVFALMTVLSWGVYGVFLHTGQTQMKPPGVENADPSILRYKAFLFVGIAYFLVAVLAPLAMLMTKGEAFSGYTSKGMGWSLVAGIVGAIGAFGVLLAFGAKGTVFGTRGTPPVVMSIVFAGAPIVNALAGMLKHRPSSVNPMFFVGIALAAVGGCLVTYFNPGSPVAKPKPVPIQAASQPPAN